MSLQVHSFGINLTESWLRRVEESCFAALSWSTCCELYKQLSVDSCLHCTCFRKNLDGIMSNSNKKD